MSHTSPSVRQTAAGRVLLVGWDAAEWKIIRPLISQGLLPNLAWLIQRGEANNLHCPLPLLSPTLWTSIVTGQHATRHGVLGSVEMAEDGLRCEPLGRSQRQVPAVWSLLHRAGMPCHTINFPATHPAEPTGGVSISNRFALDEDPLDSAWPWQHQAALTALRVTPSQIDRASLLSFVPRAGELQNQADPRMAQIAAILAHTATVHAAATWAMQNVPWQFTAICYTGLHQFSHGFMAYHPPHATTIGDPDFAIFDQVITAAYRFHDMMLGRLLALAGPAAHVMLVSDHGFYCDHQRPPSMPSTEQSMLAWHRPVGVYVMAKPSPSAQTTTNLASVYDVTPTILDLFGIQNHDVSEAKAESPAKPSAAPDDPAVAYLKQLGYAQTSDAHAELQKQQLADHRNFNLAVAWLDAHRPQEAITLLQKLIKRKPDSVKYRQTLAHAYAAARQIGPCRLLVDDLLRENPTSAATTAAAGMLELMARRAAAALIHLHKAEELGLRTPELMVDMGQAYLRLRKYADAHRAFKQAMALDPDLPAAHGGAGMALLGEGDATAAIDACQRAVALLPSDAKLQYGLGLSLLRAARLTEAKAALAIALQIEPEFVAALHQLSEVCNRLGQLTDSLDYARRAHLASTRHRMKGFAAEYKARPFLR